VIIWKGRRRRNTATENRGREKHVQQRIAREIYGKIVIWIGGEEI